MLRGLVLALSSLAFYASSTASRVRYLVIGAGPGGLQIAHYLASAGRDYIVLDSAPAPASFFAKFPRWRQLISINKAEVGRADSLSFAERHDWNSLLSDSSHSANPGFTTSTDARLDVASVAPELRFTSWATDYFPGADALVDYMRAWAAAGNTTVRGLGRAAPIRVRANETVIRVSRTSSWEDAAPDGAGTERWRPRFVVTTASGATFLCRYLIVATGLQTPVPLPSLNGTLSVAAGLVHTYADAPVDLAWYRGKRVLVIGHGNAAWEFAHHILGVTAFTHVAGRTTSRVKLALETHYPGNVRHVHASLLETYNLKSLDGITSAPFEKLEFSPAGVNGSGVVVSVRDAVGCVRDAYGRPTSRCSFRYPYDAVIACLGWRFDTDVFDEAVRPVLAPNGKHPDVSHRYESSNVQGIFFAGTLAHGPDYRRSSGGFIHGFRYTARALHRFLEEEEEAEGRAARAAATANVGQDGASAKSTADEITGVYPQSWPSTRTKSLRALVTLLLKRCNDGAGIYQMFGSLVDVFVFDDVPHSADVDADAAFAEHAAMERPFDYYDSDAAAAAADGSDLTGISASVAAAQQSPPARRTTAERAAEAAVDAALAGKLLEEVPVLAARSLALSHAAARTTAAWLTLSLEFGDAAQPGEHDPFALGRADVGLSRANRSHFIHPVVRFFLESSCGGASVSSDGKADAGVACAPVAEVHVVEDFLSEWRLHRAHVLPLSRFLQDVGARRALSVPSVWPPPPLLPPPAFLGGVLAQLASGCDSATLHFRGASHDVGGGGGEGWWLTLSIAAERALYKLRALAVHAVDGAPGVRVSAAEEAHTASVREKWAAARAGAPHIPDETTRPDPLPVNDAAAKARKEAALAYSALTRGSEGVGVLVIDARTGRCRVLAERLGVSVDSIRVFEPGGADGTKGTSVDINVRPVNATYGATHIRQVLSRAK